MISFRLQEDVAQPVEQLTFNERVVGSIPTVLTCFSCFFTFRGLLKNGPKFRDALQRLKYGKASHIRCTN